MDNCHNLQHLYTELLTGIPRYIARSSANISLLIHHDSLSESPVVAALEMLFGHIYSNLICPFDKAQYIYTIYIICM